MLGRGNEVEVGRVFNYLIGSIGLAEFRAKVYLDVFRVETFNLRVGGFECIVALSVFSGC